MRKLITIFFLFIAVSGMATTYYIDPSGNNSNTGSIGSPWLTLYKATSTVNGVGDIIHVNAGTYVETLTSQLAPGVSIEGVGVTSIIKSSFSTIFQAIIQCLSAENTDGNQHISFIKIDGQTTTSWGIQIQGRKNFSIHNCTFVDIAQRGVIWGGRADNSDAPPTIYATGNTFYNNTMTNCSSFDGTIGYGCLGIGGQEGMLIHDNSIINNVGSTPGWPIKYWNGGYIRGVKIYNNTLKRPAFPNASNGDSNYFDFAIEFFYESGLEIYNNIIEGATDVNFQTKDTYPYSVYFHDNTVGTTSVAPHWEDGVILEFYSEYIRIENNTFRNLTFPLFWSLRPTNYMNNVTVKNNLAYNIGNLAGNQFGYFCRIDVNDGSQNYTASTWDVEWNTALTYAPATPFFGMRIPAGTGSSNITINNNIFSGFSFNVFKADPANSINVLNIRNNILYNVNTINFIGSPANYTNNGNLNTNPNLNSTGNVYTPNIGSPAIHGATDGTDIGYTGGGVAFMTITTSSPANAATGVLVNTHPTITFSENIDATTVTALNITLTQAGVPKTIGFSTAGAVVTLNPAVDLSYSLPYVITIGTGVLGVSGASLNSPQAITFTTTSAPNNKIITQYLIIQRKS